MKEPNLHYIFKERHVYHLEASPLIVRETALGQSNVVMVEATRDLLMDVFPVSGVYKQYFQTTGKSFTIDDEFLFTVNGAVRCHEDVVILLHSDRSGKYMECLFSIEKVRYKRECFKGDKRWQKDWMIFVVDKVLLKGVNLKLSDEIYTIDNRNG